MQRLEVNQGVEPGQVLECPPTCPFREPPGPMLIRPFQDSDATAVIALWETCGLTRPWNDPHKDIARKLRQQAELFLVGTEFDEIVGTVMAGYEGHRGWINYLAVHPTRQGLGLGRQLMDAAERLLRQAGCPKINLQVRSDNLTAVEFYRQLGFQQDPVLSFGKRLEQD